MSQWNHIHKYCISANSSYSEAFKQTCRRQCFWELTDIFTDDVKSPEVNHMTEANMNCYEIVKAGHLKYRCVMKTQTDEFKTASKWQLLAMTAIFIILTLWLTPKPLILCQSWTSIQFLNPEWLMIILF